MEEHRLGAALGDSSESANSKPLVSRVRFRKQFKKTQLCRFWANGSCWNSDDCTFAHGRNEVQGRPDLYKTSICENWTKGCCRYESQHCQFAHGHQELRATPLFVKTTLCKDFFRGFCSLGDMCRHAHSNDELQLGQQQMEDLQSGIPDMMQGRTLSDQQQFQEASRSLSLPSDRWANTSTEPPQKSEWKSHSTAEMESSPSSISSIKAALSQYNLPRPAPAEELNDNMQCMEPGEQEVQRQCQDLSALLEIFESSVNPSGSKSSLPAAAPALVDRGLYQGVDESGDDVELLREAYELRAKISKLQWEKEQQAKMIMLSLQAAARSSQRSEPALHMQPNAYEAYNDRILHGGKSEFDAPSASDARGQIIVGKAQRQHVAATQQQKGGKQRSQRQRPAAWPSDALVRAQEELKQTHRDLKASARGACQKGAPSSAYAAEPEPILSHPDLIYSTCQSLITGTSVYPGLGKGQDLLRDEVPEHVFPPRVR